MTKMSEEFSHEHKIPHTLEDLNMFIFLGNTLSLGVIIYRKSASLPIEI